MSLSDMLQQAATQDSLEIQAGWGQGRATYGGLVAALLLARGQAVAGGEKPVRSLPVSFIGPVAPGPVRLSVEVLRRGKSVTQLEARLWQQDAVQVVMLVSLGASRDSVVKVPVSTLLPDMMIPEAFASLPWMPLMPEFLQQVELRYAGGGFPFSGSVHPDFRGWMRFREPLAHFGLPALLGLVDAWPPSTLPLLSQVVPASTLCWTVEFLAEPEPDAGTAWWAYDVQTDYAADGYGHAEARVWNASGQLMAISRQTTTVFA